MKTCLLCDKTVHARELCMRHYSQLPDQKANRIAYLQSPKGKKVRAAYNSSGDKIAHKKWAQSPKGKACLKEYNQKPEMKTYHCNWMRIQYAIPESKINIGQRAYRQHPEVRAKDLEYERSPKRKAYHKAWKKSPNGKISARKCGSKRRLLGYDIINPEFAKEPDFCGHHIDRDHVLFIPREIHESIPHSQKKSKTMERINTAAFAWLLGVR